MPEVARASCAVAAAPKPTWIPMLTNDKPAPPERHHTPLLKIGSRRCRYIVSDTTRDAVCCGAPTISDVSSWCAYHARLVYEPRLSAAERDRRRAA
jgi:hypothetical protein